MSARSLPLAAVVALLLLSGAAGAQTVLNPANGHFYALTGTVTDVTAARAQAAAMGGALVTIDDAAENAFLVSTFLAAGGRLWIGLSDELVEGVFVWDDGSPLTFVNWAAGEPNNTGPGGVPENHVEIQGSGFWNDIAPTDPFKPTQGIVEIALGPPERFALAPGATLVVGSGGAATVTGTVAAIHFAQGAVIDQPAADAAVGATLQVQGTLIGPAATLAGAGLAVASVQVIAAPGADELNLLGTFVHDTFAVPDFRALAGPLGATPTLVRTLHQSTTGTSTRVGSGSHALDDLHGLLQQGVLADLVFEIDPVAGPRLVAFAPGFVAPPPAPAAELATDGAGSLELGVIDVPAGAELRCLFTNTLPATAGGGPFFGLAFDALILQELLMPPGTTPFHVAASPAGTYHLTVPSGIILGVTLDALVLARAPGAPTFAFVSPVMRRVF